MDDIKKRDGVPKAVARRDNCTERTPFIDWPSYSLMTLGSRLTLVYSNEESVGEAIKGIDRAKLYITTKAGEADVRKSLEASLKKVYRSARLRPSCLLTKDLL